MNDSWQADHSSALRLAQKVSEAIEKRNNHDRLSSQFARCSNEARSSMAQYKDAVVHMSQTHIRNSRSYHFSEREIERRQGMLEELQTKEKQLEQMLQGDSTASGFSGSSYGQAAGSSVNPWAIDDDFANDMNVNEIRQHQQNLVAEQDEGLRVLSEVINRQKSMGETIGNEIDRQDALIDDIGHAVDKTDSRVREETNRVRQISLKENRGNCAMWVVIILLFVAIIVIVCIPYKK